MSAKWRALQHRHRYTYTSIPFPVPFLETLASLPPSDFSSHLNSLTSMTSTYSQISAAKDLSSSFARLLASPQTSAAVASAAARLLLEILFLDNSLPLHRTIISALAKTRNSIPTLIACFASLCADYSRPGRRRFSVSRAALSLMGFPKLGFLASAVDSCSATIAIDVAAGLAGVVADVGAGSRPSPAVMEQCQEAMSCLYYLLQRYPSRFVGSDYDQAFHSVVRTILTVLKSPAFSRDCLVAAGVSFCAAIQACMSAAEISSFIARGFFGVDGENDELCVKKLLPDGDLYAEVKHFSVLSRICLLRGILTAIPRPILNIRSSSGSCWTVLCDGILPELCRYCENPVDSHFNFHVLTVTQICLQQIKTSLSAGVTDMSENYDPLPDAMVSRILRIIWNNLDDPLSQTVKQVHLILDLLLDIVSALPLGENNERTKLLMCKISSDLLHLGPRCKGRYSPLASVTARLGAKHLLDLNPSLLSETIHAYIDDDVCCALTSFLKCFLECLRDECWSQYGIEEGYDVFRGLCLPPLLQGLVSGHSKLRSNLNTYALPTMLEVDTDSIFTMLGFISLGPSKEENRFGVDLKINQCVAALVSLLKVSRGLALIDGDIDLDHESVVEQNGFDHVAVVCVKGINVRIPLEWFILAVTHADESLRIDAAESLFLNHKTSSLPSSIELSLMREAVPLNMRCCSTAFQMKWTSLFRKFFARVRTALERQLKQGSWQPIACVSGKDNGPDHRAENLFHFMKWLSCFLIYSCYPSAPYERKTMAMALMLIMVDVWPICPHKGNHDLQPYTEEFTSPESTLSLVGSIVDSWDRLRESSFRILSCFPTPLPGISSHGSVIEVISWAKKLVCSPRVRESDAGALSLRLVFRKYILELGWLVKVSDGIVCSDSRSTLSNGDITDRNCRIPVVVYLSSIIEWLHDVVNEAETDLSESCRNSFVHGVLLTLRYTFEELDWNSEIVLSSGSEMRCLLEKLLALIMRVTTLALWVVSADAWYMPCDIDDMVEDSTFLSDMAFEVDTSEPLSEPAAKILQSDDNDTPADRVVMVGCWLAMKEVSLLLGTIIRKIPLPSCSILDSPEPDLPLGNDVDMQDVVMVEGMFDLQQLETIGNHFLQVLLKMKHNGAIDKTRAGFTALCNRLLCSNDPRLCSMTESWMDQLMQRIVAKDQTLDDLLRRSAGIPAAFIALFLSEPEGTPKKLLPQALRWLIDVVNMKSSSKDSSETPLETTTSERHADARASKIQDEGVIPTVHAFNVLKAAFNDTNLAADTSGFSAEALIVSIRSFSSPYWQVRNSACLAYTALVRRMIGFLNVQKRESARRALTGLEFFHRYPALHPFLFCELKIATELLGDGSARHMGSNIAKAIHPSLCPILILLSRLKPSLLSSGTDDALDPFVFMPFIRRCATQSNLRVRVLASRALTGLVSNEKLHAVLVGVANDLPHERHPKPISSDNCFSTLDINGAVTTATDSVSFNYIHGVLLQLSSLIDCNCRTLTDIDKKDHILTELTQVLLNCSWIGNISSCPCPTLNSSYLRVLDQMLSITKPYNVANTCKIQSLLLELASDCLDTKNNCGLTLNDPTTVELRRQAAVSYFGCLFGAESFEEGFELQRTNRTVSQFSNMTDAEIHDFRLHERIVSCISDSTYEVRVATLKKLLQMVKLMKHDDEGKVCTWARTHLQSTLVKLLVVEENPKCIYYILTIIFKWNTVHSEKLSGLKIVLDRDSANSLWHKLVHLNSTVMRAKTREILLCCMGICVKQFVSVFRTSIFGDITQIKQVGVDPNNNHESKEWSIVYSYINYFVILVKQQSAPSEPVNLRMAAAEAIMASGLLEEASLIVSHVSNNRAPSEVSHAEEKIISHIDKSEVVNLFGSRMLDIWFTCIQLLEDEDAVLRKRLAEHVQMYIDSRGSKRYSCITVPAQVEKVIESCFEFLSSLFGHWLQYFDYLSTWVLNTASSVSSRGDLVRQIFDKEIDNHHEEKLLICQICCSHLEKLMVSQPWAVEMYSRDINKSSIEMFFQSLRVQFLRQMISFANHLETEVRTHWIGGISNHKDAFIPLYVNLLGLYALTQCSNKDHHSSGQVADLGGDYLAEFAKLIGINRQLRSNPLISNLYFLVIRSHERFFGVSLTLPSTEDQSAQKGFDPYFLLR